MFYAHAAHPRMHKDTARRFDTAEQAADHLAVLLRLDGWTHDDGMTRARLIAGETIEHKTFAYSVSQEP